MFWSKNPRPLIESGLLDYLDERGVKCYIQYTLNDYEKEGLEKGVKPLEYRIDTFRMLVERLGKRHVIWRFDPLILTDNIGQDELLEKIQRIGGQLNDLSEKLVFSFADIQDYAKVKRNLSSNGILYKEWNSWQMQDFAGKLSNLNKSEGWNYRLATCAEQIDLLSYGIEKNKCIDGDLIVKLAWRDKKLMKHLGVEIKELEQELFVYPPDGAVFLDDTHYFLGLHKKDLGQRKFCGCIAAKDIGEYNTCAHLCEYCYANASKNIALENYRLHKLNNGADTITGR